MASRSSATFLPEKSSGARDAADAAASPALRAPFAAVCWRPRAFPPAFAARLRAAVLPDELELERRLVELPELLRELELRDFAAELRELDPLLRELEALRDPEPLAREPPLRELALRDPDPEVRDPVDDFLADGFLADDFRDDDPLEPRPEDDPPPLPRVDSAIVLSSSEAPAPLSARCGPHYRMPRVAATYA
jgi:hypothetical protein